MKHVRFCCRSRLKNEITQNQTRLESEREQRGEQKQIDEYESKKARQRHDLSEEIIKAAKEHMSVLKQQSEVNCAKLVETQLVAQSMQLKDELKEYESRQSTLEQELRAAEQTATKVRGDREELHKKAAEEATLTDELRYGGGACLKMGVAWILSLLLCSSGCSKHLRREEFKKWPDEQSELESKKEEKEVERDGITIANPNALQEYKARKARIDELGEKLDSERSNLQQKQDSLKQVKQRWLPALRSLVQRLDKCFSDNFRKIGCRGGIELIEDEENFDKFRIDIKVAFRDSEGLHPLDGRRQSGGERSVSTMLYIIALQNLTKSPFRVVDEINQGMDVENEKHVRPLSQYYPFYMCHCNSALGLCRISFLSHNTNERRCTNAWLRLQLATRRRSALC
jgi:chromosome segregation ATPase